jgi:beta-galactosidase
MRMTNVKWAVTIAVLLIAVGTGVFLAACSSASRGATVSSSSTADAIDLSNAGWRLWLDPDAAWTDDTLYLPDEVDLAKLPTNLPTGGWSALSSTAGIPVTLPGTVEEHDWSRTLTASATPSQIVEHNGSYKGVSWWYRNFTAPVLAAGERCQIHFRGTRLRAEVYVNQKLVGYNIITELPFTVDATAALRPGAENQLAVRITNPGGQLAWDDNGTIRWGDYAFPMSHGFGGVDGGVQMSVRGPVHVSELTVLNTPDPATVTLAAEVASTGTVYHGPVSFSVRRDGKTIFSTTADADVPANGSTTVTRKVTVPSADLWDINHPSLYEADARVPNVAHSDCLTPFGCRWFAPTGIGSDAKLQLNGRRIVVKSSISWGYWAPNGMFPDEAAVAREVAAVKALGLNSIQNHRHMPKEVVLEGFDRAGLLRYCEPGAGVQSFSQRGGPAAPRTGPVDISGEGGEPKTFTARYEMFKTLGMVKAFRSHPSVSVWTLQNETSPDLHNPSIFWMIRKMHEIDPSRTVVLKSGVDTRNQVLMEAYSEQVRASDASGFSGWWDQHTAEDSKGVYLDSMYNSPIDFEYRSENRKEIVAWGEMATGASPDNHSAVARWYAEGNKPGYDRLAAETIRDNYQKFIDTYGFKTAFPNAEALFLQAGNKHYFSSARILENARISDPIDYVVLSGWESTIIDNHSGMTDALRELKGDPAPLHRAGADQVLVLRPRHYVVARGEPIVFDVHLINEHKRQGDQVLAVTVNGPAGERLLDSMAVVNIAGGDTYGQLLKDGFTVTAAAPGTYTLTARLRAAGNNPDPLERTEQVLVIDPEPSRLEQRIAYIDDTGLAGALLKDRFHADAAPLASADNDVNRILIDADFVARTWRTYRPRAFGPTANVAPAPAPADPALDPLLFDVQSKRPPAGLLKLAVPNGKTQV